MTQFAIAFNAAHAARSNDPATSQAAARRAKTFADSHAGRILMALREYGPMTAKELHLHTGLDVVRVDRRLPDLLKSGRAEVVKLADGMDMTRNGFRVWRAKESS